MSNVVDHYLKTSNLKQLLLNSGVVESRTLHGAGNREVHCEYVLNMRKCHEDEWVNVEHNCIEHGVVDFSKKNDDGKYGVRRDLTNEEITELPYWPIFFDNDDEICWFSKWRNNDDPAFFVSKLFPDISFNYDMFYEGEWDGGFIVTNGVFTATDEWKARLEEIQQEKELSYDKYDEAVYTANFNCDDSSFPF